MHPTSVNDDLLQTGEHDDTVDAAFFKFVDRLKQMVIFCRPILPPPPAPRSAAIAKMMQNEGSRWQKNSNKYRGRLPPLRLPVIVSHCHRACHHVRLLGDLTSLGGGGGNCWSRRLIKVLEQPEPFSSPDFFSSPILGSGYLP